MIEQNRIELVLKITNEDTTLQKCEEWTHYSSNSTVKYNLQSSLKENVAIKDKQNNQGRIHVLFN